LWSARSRWLAVNQLIARVSAFEGTNASKVLVRADELIE
jgi:hypothetical protein